MSQCTAHSETARLTASAARGMSGNSRLRAAEVEPFETSASERDPYPSQPVRNPRNTIPAVNRAMDLVQILAGDEDETHTKALALRLGIPPTTCYRILCSLIGRGWVQRVADGRHVLSPWLHPRGRNAV